MTLLMEILGVLILWAIASLAAIVLPILALSSWKTRGERRPRPPAIHGPPGWKPKAPKPVQPPVGYVRRWTGRRKALVQHDHDLWQEDFDRQADVARRAGGLHFE